MRAFAFKRCLVPRQRGHGSRSLAAFAEKHIKMPTLGSAETGTLERWLKNEGDSFAGNETICEVTVGGVTIGIDIDDPGLVADILVPGNTEVPVGTDLMCVTDGHESYMAYIVKKVKITAETAAIHPTFNEASTQEHSIDNEEKHPSTQQEDSTNTIDCLQAIKHLVKSEKLNLDHDQMQVLLGLARRGDMGLMQIFHVSCKSGKYEVDTFDSDFFAVNVELIVNDRLGRNKEREATIPESASPSTDSAH